MNHRHRAAASSRAGLPSRTCTYQPAASLEKEVRRQQKHHLQTASNNQGVSRWGHVRKTDSVVLKRATKLRQDSLRRLAGPCFSAGEQGVLNLSNILSQAGASFKASGSTYCLRSSYKKEGFGWLWTVVLPHEGWGSKPGSHQTVAMAGPHSYRRV